MPENISKQQLAAGIHEWIKVANHAIANNDAARASVALKIVERICAEVTAGNATSIALHDAWLVAKAREMFNEIENDPTTASQKAAAFLKLVDFNPADDQSSDPDHNGEGNDDDHC